MSFDLFVERHFFIKNNELGPSNVVLNPIIKKIDEANGVLLEFSKLINSECKESVLEEFLRVNYKLIFGNNYDSISTQVWLNFPEYDIGKRDRRLDIFIRNSVTTDWELFELKRSNVQLTKTISDVPMFVSAVNEAIAQAKNYKRILSQDYVRKAFERQGILYYKPEINLVTIHDALQKDEWNEKEISLRAQWLFEQAEKIWTI